MQWIGCLLAIVAFTYAQSSLAKLTQQCHNDAQCPANSSCSENQCFCKPGFDVSYDRKSCVQVIGAPCNASFECGSYAKCESKICRCEDGYTPFSGRGCERIQTLGAYCNEEKFIFCGGNAVCHNHRCTCLGGYIPTDNKEDCTPSRQLLGYPCSNNSQCGKGAYCVQVTQPLPVQWTKGLACNCRSHYREANRIDCEYDSVNQCVYDYQCPKNSWCAGGPCSCLLGYEDNGEGCEPSTFYSITKTIAVSVVGGIVGLTILIGLIWFIIRTKRRAQHSQNTTVIHSTNFKNFNLNNNKNSTVIP